MQVKKFEARSMKEALEMIKRELGPDAIILSAKDNSQRYGLLGEGSVEVTAAISESSLQRKKFVETRLPDHLKENFHRAPAQKQKEWVEKFVQTYRREQEQETKVAQETALKKKAQYIDIQDERVTAKSPSELVFESSIARPSNLSKEAPVDQGPAAVGELKREIEDLRTLVKQLSQGPSASPQTITPALINLPVEMISIFDRLRGAGLTEEFALSLLDEAKKQLSASKLANRTYIEGWVVNYVMQQARIKEPSAKLQLFVGPSGSGKTSFMVKWASELIIQRKKKVALLTADHYKVGAVQQARMYAQILHIPFASVKSKNDWPYILEQLEDFDYILCDFQGLNLNSDDEKLYIKGLLPSPSISYDCNLVLNASTNRSDLNQAYLNYRVVQPNHLVFTRLDESKQKAFLFELSHRHKCPIFGFSLGQKIPEDFEGATRERLVDFVLKISTHGGVDAIR